MEAFDVVILAAGKGERMISEKPKVMHEIMGKPLIDYVVNAALELDPNRVTVVTGHRREVVEEHLEKFPGVVCAAQTEQKGTAHALLSAGPFLTGGDVLVLYGDVPLITVDTLKDFTAFYGRNRSIVFMTTDVENPTGYGRVISKGELILEIREQIDASPEELLIKEINTGICVIPRECWPYLTEIGNNNKKGEYYLTDICTVVKSKGEVVRKYKHHDACEVLGVNSRKELLDSNMAMRMRIIEKHLKNGVSFIDSNVYIDNDVQIGRDTIIYPNCHISGRTVIGARVTVGPDSLIRDSRIHDGVSIRGFSAIEDAEVFSDVVIGPFSRLRPGTTIGKDAQIGNFVEIKNSVIGERTRANHLTYIGDASVGKDVNVGAGSITCNFDGATKHRTTIEDNAFIGSNSELIAPISIGRGAVIGAGSTITRNVPDEALATSRSEQKHVENYRRKKKCVE